MRGIIHRREKMGREDNLLQWQRNKDRIEREEELDGIYVVRTSEACERLSA